MFRSSPYRVTRREAVGRKPPIDRDLLPVFALLWAMSVAVVVRCVLRHDVFGAQATLALALAVALPILVVARSRDTA